MEFLRGFSWQERVGYPIILGVVCVIASYGWHGLCKRMPVDVSNNVVVCGTCSVASFVTDVTDTATQKCFQMSSKLYEDARRTLKSI